MEKKNDSKKRHPFLELGMIILLMITLSFLLSNQFYTLLSMFIIVISFLLVMGNRKNVSENIGVFLMEWKKLKKLEYYRITDDNKNIDLAIRLKISSLFRDTTINTVTILIINFIAIFNLIQHFIGKSTFLPLLTIMILSLIIFIGYGGIVISIVYSFTTATYVTIPIISAIIYFSIQSFNHILIFHNLDFIF